MGFYNKCIILCKLVLSNKDRKFVISVIKTKKKINSKFPGLLCSAIQINFN